MTEPHDEHRHPAAKAAQLIKQLHQDNIDLIDSGHVFTKDGVSVNDEIRAASVEQMKMCDQIIDRAPHMSDEHTVHASLHLRDLQLELTRLKGEQQVEQSIPEVGDYEHRET